jgi:hypothetical protein
LLGALLSRPLLLLLLLPTGLLGLARLWMLLLLRLLLLGRLG